MYAGFQDETPIGGNNLVICKVYMIVCGHGVFVLQWDHSVSIGVMLRQRTLQTTVPLSCVTTRLP